MKKIIILGILSFFTLSAGLAQNKIKPLNDFEGDTLKYAEYNYSPDKTFFYNSPIKELLDASDLKFQSYSLMYDFNGSITRIMLYYSSVEEIANPNMRRYPSIIVLLDPIPKNNQGFENLEKSNEKHPLNEDNKSLIEDYIIKQIIFVIVNK